MLAQTSAERAPGEILPILLLLAGLVIAGGLVLLLVRRLIHRSGSNESAGFTLQDLRDLHASGELTDEEFDRARAQMIGRATRSDQPDNRGVSAGNAAE